MAEYKESVPTLGEEINKLFFGEKGLYSLIKLDKETIDLICNRIDKDYPEYLVKEKVSKGNIEITAEKEGKSVRFIGKPDITGGTEDIYLTVIEDEEGLYSERQYLGTSKSGRYGIYQNKLTFLPDKLETSLSKEIYQHDFTDNKPIIMIGDRRIYLTEDLKAVDPVGMINFMKDTRQIINLIISVKPVTYLQFTYSVGLNEFSVVDIYTPVTLKVSLNGESKDIPVSLVNIDKKDLEVVKLIGDTEEFKKYLDSFKQAKVEETEEIIKEEEIEEL